MVKNTRIGIVQGDSKTIQLAGNIKAKHITEGPASPLTALMTPTLSDHIDRAVDNDNKLTAIDAEGEQRRQVRKNDAVPMGEFVRAARDILQGVNRDTLRKLNDWGFKVDDTPRQKKSPPPSDATK